MLSNLDREDPVWKKRPEQLGVEEFIALTLKIEDRRKSTINRKMNFELTREYIERLREVIEARDESDSER